MKKFTQAGKKALSVFLAALMVMTAWVFVAPEAQAQSAGKYTVKVNFYVRYGGIFKDAYEREKNKADAFGYSIECKDTNGTASLSYWKDYDMKDKIKDKDKYSDSITFSNVGFPIRLFGRMNHDQHWGDNEAMVTVQSIEVGNSDWSVHKTVWTGEGKLDSKTNGYWIRINMDKAAEYSDSDKDGSYAADTTKDWSMPTPTTVNWNPTTLSAMTCPKTGESTQTIMKVTAKDQYGVNMYDPTWSVKGSSCGTTGISMSTGSSRAESSTIKLTNAANIAGTTDTQTGTVTATWGSGQTKSKTFTINDTTYTATFTGLKNNDGTDKANVTANYKHGYVPTAAETASEYDVGDYHRTFSHWSPSIGAITSDTTYNARYSESFVGANLTELNNQISRANDVKSTDLWKTSSYTPETMSALESALEAAIAKRDSNPGRTQQAAVDAAAKNIKDAIDALKLKSYMVKFYNAEGLIIKTQEVVAGQAATAPASPAKNDDETYHYSFKAWNKAFSNVTSNLDVRPTYTPQAHIWQASTTVQANCQHGAGIKKTCSVCSRVSESYDDTLGAHTKSTHYAVSREATCTTDGTGYYYCTVCGTNMGNVTIKAKGHTYDKGEVTKAATCTATGTRVHKCNSCGDTYTEILEKIPHTYAKTSTVAATCKHSAYDVMQCSCGDTYNKYVGGIAEHELVWTVKNATSASSGSVTGKCKNCDYTFTKEVPFDGHNYDFDNPTIKAATCNADGSVVIGCKDAGCTEKITIKLNKTGVHNYTTKYNAPNCTKAGSIVNTCSVCNASTTVETIAALGHNYGEAVVTPATCTTDGKMVYTCARCNDVKTVPILATGHKEYVIDAIEATCNTKGRTEGKKCAVCGEVILASTEIAKKAHSFTGEVKTIAATCDADGATLTKCANCDAWKIDNIPAIGHNYKAEVVASTCTSKGYTKHTCQNCGKVYTDNETAMIAHNYVLNADLSLAPSCEGEGVNISVCSVCGSSKSEKVDAKGHSFGEWSEYIPATCTTDRVEQHVCSVCNQVKIKTVPNTKGHSWNPDFTTDIPATCTTAGVQSKHCSRCDARTDVTVIPAPGHSNKTVTQEASCLKPSVSYTYCTTCNTLISKVTVGNALGHDFVEDAEQYVAPTNDKNGEKVLKCSRCDETITVVIPAQGHKFELVSKVDATCEKTGLETYKCTTHTGDNDCGLSYTNVIPMKAHTYAKRVETEPTCTIAGEGECYCSVCNEVFGTYEIPALGHDFSKETANVASTCNSVGYVTKQCSRCDETETTYSSTLADHKWGDWETVQTADETHPGIKVRKCSVCDLYQYETEPPTGEHDYDDGVVTKKPTCTEPGVKTFTCRRTHCACTPGNEKSYTVEIAPTGHKAKIEKKDATCSEAGYIKVVCETCGATIGESITLEKKKHIYQSTVTIEPTCSKEGVRTYTCALCGDSYTETIAKISHDYQPTGRTVAPTCTTEGFDIYECKYCAKETFVKTAEKLGHTERTVTIDATCTEKGSKTVVCSVCNTIVRETEYTPALGHDWGEWKVTVPGTCEVEGKKTRECSRCHKTETISTGTGEHVYPEKGVVTPATCTADGYTTYTCTVCNKYSVIRDYTPKLGHKYSADYKIIVEPTCHSTGTKAHYCVRCGAFEPDYLHNYVELPKLAHTYGEWVVTAEPTCDTNGVKTRTCTGCTDKDEGHTQTELIGKKGHNYGEWEITKKSTCVEEGSQRRYCDRCKTWEVQTTPKGGHNRVADYAVEATCTAPGKTAGSHCSICGYVFVAQQEVPMKEHMDLNGDGRCEGCGKTMYSPNGETDSCLCHGTGFRAFIYKIVLIIWKIFKINKNCVCGAKHY